MNCVLADCMEADVDLLLKSNVKKGWDFNELTEMVLTAEHKIQEAWHLTYS